MYDIVIIGSDSMIGIALARRAERLGKKILRTTRRRGTEGPDRVFLDLANSIETWNLPPTKSVVYCAGMTSIEECQRFPTISERINACAAIHIGQKAKMIGAYFLFLSSDEVNSGLGKSIKTRDHLPDTSYGQSKARAEDGLVALGRGVSILRLGKVWAFPPRLFLSWRANLCAGAAIEAFTDHNVAPLLVGSVAEVLMAMLARPYDGLFEASASSQLTYATLAEKFVKKLGYSPALVHKTLKQVVAPIGKPRENAVLSTLRMSEIYGITFCTAEQTVDRAIKGLSN